MGGGESEQRGASTPVDAKIDAERARLEALKSGDPAATERWVREEAPRMRAVALRLLKDEAAADDAVQEAFMNAFRQLGSFEGRARLSTWLHRIVVNAALGRLRKRDRQQAAQRELEGPQFAPEGYLAPTEGRRWAPIETMIHAEETRARVRRMIDQLPEAARTVLILRDIEELNTAETARALGVSVGTVKTRLHRARMQLKKAIEAEMAVEAGA